MSMLLVTWESPEGLTVWAEDRWGGAAADAAIGSAAPPALALPFTSDLRVRERPRPPPDGLSSPLWSPAPRALAAAPDPGATLLPASESGSTQEGAALSRVAGGHSAAS
jgi:hypothetical protein